MCKYCDLDPMMVFGTEHNTLNPIFVIEDGSHVISLDLYRKIDVSEKIRKAELSVDYGVGANILATIKEKSIEIKYCPFCGEEL